MTALAISVLVNSVSIIAVAVMLMRMARDHRRLADEVIEMQALLDLLLLDAGKRAVFARRFGVDIERVDDDG